MELSGYCRATVGLLSELSELSELSDGHPTVVEHIVTHSLSEKTVGTVGNCRELSGTVGNCRELSGTVGLLSELSEQGSAPWHIGGDLPVI